MTPSGSEERIGAREASFESVEACPFCRSTSHSADVSDVADYFFATYDGTSDFARCSDCGSLWQQKRLVPHLLAQTYKNYYTHELPSAEPDQVKSGGLKEALRECYVRWRFANSARMADVLGAISYRLVARELDRLDVRYRYTPRGPAKILDYGCGNGDWLRIMRGMGHDVSGVDFDLAAIAVAAQSEIPVFTPDQAAELDWSEKFDAVTLSHVIEHVPDPRALLQQVYSWLKPGGIIYVEAPHANAEGLAVFGRYWRGLEAPRHLAIPSRVGLLTALKHAGFANPQSAIVRQVRSWVWERSLSVIKEDERGEVNERWRDAQEENIENSEYLAFALQKPQIK
ncbi:hypothetical protein GCM10009127_03140 [Alteraurantiacibacter aestuarii]|uniref:Methyltransferase domain-containing protein n=1 Tax=Alteraurantiacibacter aestuarii TaxID=650004 RepID=A0A844ZM92_9SPHN|nr:class I SAM-dependent methyltransferase [Alteraurantiacibacter aestuarii]MXO88432.1 methyltransferase domain-containing protein [Alteraurantiacibacter aestuarii]